MANAPGQPNLTSAQRRRVDDFAATFGYAPIVGGARVDLALAQIGATGGVLLHQGAEFEDEYVVILPGGATIPVQVGVTENEMTITIKGSLEGREG